MSKKALLAIAIMGILAAPAMADLTTPLRQLPTHPGLQQINPGGPGTVGVLNSLGTFASSNAMLYPNASDIIVVTFGIHQPYVTPLFIEGIRNGLRFDTTEVVILGAGPAGPFVTNNIGTTPAAGAAAINAFVAPLGGTEQVVGIEQFPAAPFVFLGSSTVPFFRVTFHAVGPFAHDGIVDLLAPSLRGSTMGTSTGVGLIFRTFTTSIAHTAFSSLQTLIIPGPVLFISAGVAWRPSFGVELKPEPASATLLGMGALALTGGLWRRRRRQA